MLRRSRWCRTSCARRAAAEATGLPGWPAAYAACCARVRASAALWERRPRRDAATDQALHRCEGAAPTLSVGPAPGLSKLLRALSLWESLVFVGVPRLCGSASSLWERRPRRDAATDQALHRCEGAAPTLPSRLCPGLSKLLRALSLWESLVFVGAPPSARCGHRSSAASLRGRSSHTPQSALPRACGND